MLVFPFTFEFAIKCTLYIGISVVKKFLILFLIYLYSSSEENSDVIIQLSSVLIRLCQCSQIDNISAQIVYFNTFW